MSKNNSNNNTLGPKARLKHTSRARILSGSKHTTNTIPAAQQTSAGSVSCNLATTISHDEHLALPKLPFWGSALVVAVLSIAAYWNSCCGDFVFDDLEAIVKNKDLRPDTPLASLFRNDFWGGPVASDESHKSYRPLTVLTFRLNYYLAGGLHPWGFHLVNILLHAVNSILVLPLSSVLLATSETHTGKRGDAQFSECPRSSLLCAILFAVHPIHTENVAGVVGRADLLCTIFFILSFLVYARICRKESSCQAGDYSILSCYCQLALSMGLCAAAMLCKEQGVTVISICAIYDVIINCGIDPMPAFRKAIQALQRPRVSPSVQSVLWSPELRWLRGLVFRQLILVISSVVLLSFRFVVMGTSTPVFKEVDNPASFMDSFWLRIINYSYIYSLNAWLLLNPWWLCFDWSMGCVPLILTPLDPRIVAPIVFWIIMSCLMYHCLCGLDHSERRTLMMSLAMLIVPFLPAANVFFRVGFVIAERVLYLPSLGHCLLVAMGTRHLCLATGRSPFVRKIVLSFLLLMVACHLARCVQRNMDWQTETLLYQSGLQVCPQNAKVHYNIGKLASEQDQIEEAIHAYREAIRLHPDYDQALNNLGNLLRDLNQTDEAERLISRAVQIRPTFAAAWMNLGIIQATLGKHAEAEESYLTALRHRKNYPDCFFNLGNLYLDERQWQNALRSWEGAVRQKSDHPRAWFNMITLYDDLGHFKTAVAVGQEALRFLTEEPSIYYALGNVYGKLQQFQEAEDMFLKAIQYRPEAPSYHGNLGVLYHRWGKLEEAYVCYQRSLTLDPTSVVTAANLKKLERTLKKEKNM